MVQGDEGRQAVAVQGLHDPPVVVHLRHVPPALLRLDAAPLDGEAVGVVAQLLGQGEVLLEAVVVVAGDAGDAAVVDVAALLFPGPPVVLGAVALHLVGGGGAAPVEACGEADVGVLGHGSSFRLLLAVVEDDLDRVGARLLNGGGDGLPVLG